MYLLVLMAGPFALLGLVMALSWWEDLPLAPPTATEVDPLPPQTRAEPASVQRSGAARWPAQYHLPENRLRRVAGEPLVKGVPQASEQT